MSSKYSDKSSVIFSLSSRTLISKNACVTNGMSFTGLTVTVMFCESVYSPSVTDTLKDSLPLKSCGALKVTSLPLSSAVISEPPVIL